MSKQRTYISRRVVAEKALALVDEVGVEGFNIRGLGELLSVNGASLYYHYRSKDDILEDVVRQALRDLRFPDPADDWLDWLVQCNLGYRDALLAHPNILPILLRGNPGRYRPPAVMEYLTASFLQHGYSADDIEWILEVLEAFTIGLVLVAGTASDAGEGRGPAHDDDQFRSICRGLIELTVAAANEAGSSNGKRPRSSAGTKKAARKAAPDKAAPRKASSRKASSARRSA